MLTMPKDYRLYLAVLLAIILIVPVWITGYPPLQDYPQHLLNVKVMADHSNPKLNYSENYLVNYAPFPNTLSDVAMFALIQLVPLDIAGKIILSLGLIVFITGFFYFITSFSGNKLALGFLGFPLAYNLFFNIGFINYYLGTGLFLLVFGYWHRNRESKNSKIGLVVLGGSALVYFAHLFPFAVLVASVFISELVQSRKLRQSLSALLPLLPATALSAWFILSSLLLRGLTGHAPVYSNLLDAAFRFILFAVSFSWIDKLLFIFLWGLIVMSLWVSLRDGSIRQPQKKAAIAIALLFAASYFALPVETQSWGYVNVRIVPFAMFMLIAAGKVPDGKKKEATFIAVATAIFLIGVGFTMNSYVEIGNQIDTYVSGIEYVCDNSIVLPMMLECTGCYNTMPMLHVWAYYNIEKGGFSPYVKLFKDLSIVGAKDLPPAPHEYYPSQYAPEKHAKYYDYVIAWGNNSAVETLVEKDFGLIFENGKLKIYGKGRQC